jgi:hypothetical protein
VVTDGSHQISCSSHIAFLSLQETLALLPIKDLNLIAFRPANFSSYLIESLGFEAVAERRSEQAARGFDRQLLVFRKPAQQQG